MSDGEPKKVIIPKGTLNPDQNNIIEIPSGYEDSLILIAKLTEKYSRPPKYYPPLTNPMQKFERRVGDRVVGLGLPPLSPLREEHSGYEESLGQYGTDSSGYSSSGHGSCFSPTICAPGAASTPIRAPSMRAARSPVSPPSRRVDAKPKGYHTFDSTVNTMDVSDLVSPERMPSQRRPARSPRGGVCSPDSSVCTADISDLVSPERMPPPRRQPPSMAQSRRPLNLIHSMDSTVDTVDVSDLVSPERMPSQRRSARPPRGGVCSPDSSVCTADISDLVSPERMSSTRRPPPGMAQSRRPPKAIHSVDSTVDTVDVSDLVSPERMPTSRRSAPCTGQSRRLPMGVHAIDSTVDTVDISDLLSPRRMSPPRRPASRQGIRPPHDFLSPPRASPTRMQSSRVAQSTRPRMIHSVDSTVDTIDVSDLVSPPGSPPPRRAPQQRVCSSPDSSVGTLDISDLVTPPRYRGPGDSSYLPSPGSGMRRMHEHLLGTPGTPDPCLTNATITAPELAHSSILNDSMCELECLELEELKSLQVKMRNFQEARRDLMFSVMSLPEPETVH